MWRERRKARRWRIKCNVYVSLSSRDTSYKSVCLFLTCYYYLGMLMQRRWTTEGTTGRVDVVRVSWPARRRCSDRRTSAAVIIGQTSAPLPVVSTSLSSVITQICCRAHLNQPPTNVTGSRILHIVWSRWLGFWSWITIPSSTQD